MTEQTYNPWVGMQKSSERRIDTISIHDLFWMTDLEGNYGFYLKADRRLDDTYNDIRLKGITLLKRSDSDKNGELFLILKQKSDWSIFYMLCQDLIKVCKTTTSSDKMILAVENRLKRWQLFLKNEQTNSLSLSTQMGLFSELTFLKDFLIPFVGPASAIKACV